MFQISEILPQTQFGAIFLNHLAVTSNFLNYSFPLPIQDFPAV